MGASYDIQQVLDSGGTVTLPKGRITLDQKLYLHLANCWLVGSGEKDTILCGNVSDALIHVGSAAWSGGIKNMRLELTPGAGSVGSRPNIIQVDHNLWFTLENLDLIGDISVPDDGSDERQCGVWWRGAGNGWIRRVHVQKCKRHGLFIHSGVLNDMWREANSNNIEGYNAHHNEGCGILSLNSSHNHYTGITSEANQPGLKLVRNQPNPHFGDDNIFAGLNLEGNYTDNLVISGSGGNAFSAVEAEWANHRAVVLEVNNGIVPRFNAIASLTIARARYYALFLDDGVDDNVFSTLTIQDADKESLGGWHAVEVRGKRNVFLGGRIFITEPGKYHDYAFHFGASSEKNWVTGFNLYQGGRLGNVLDEGIGNRIEVME